MDLGKRAVVTHFDGDPFLLNFWLLCYEKYWRGECDTIYMSVFYKPDLIPPEVVGYNKELLAKFPEIKVTWLDTWKVPEAANQQLLATVTEEYIGLVESDGFVYGRGIVDQCFRLLEEGQDLVAPPWELIDEPYFDKELHVKGFMRCFFFVRKSLLDQVELDFIPRIVPSNTMVTPTYRTTKDVTLDCFGWICWQLICLLPKTTIIPNNVLGPDTMMGTYNNFLYIHVRQMQSSTLGLGGGEYALWCSSDGSVIAERVLRLFNADFPDGPAEFIHIKALAFRLLFWDLMIDRYALGPFSKEYKQVLELVIDYYGISREQVAEIKGFYRGLMRL